MSAEMRESVYEKELGPSVS